MEIVRISEFFTAEEGMITDPKVPKIPTKVMYVVPEEEEEEDDVDVLKRQVDEILQMRSPRRMGKLFPETFGVGVGLLITEKGEEVEDEEGDSLGLRNSKGITSIVGDVEVEVEGLIKIDGFIKTDPKKLGLDVIDIEGEEEEILEKEVVGV